MNWDRDTSRILQRVQTQWEEVSSALQSMSASADVRPSDPLQIFAPTPGSTEEAVEVELLPVVFNVPERPGETRTTLYIVVRGLLQIERASIRTEGSLRTIKFGTEVGYFRAKPDVLSHVFGAHFDFALDELGHPVFHAQMKSFQEFAVNVRDQFNVAGHDHDLVAGVLKTVRLPCAQMDFFSFFIQLFADHLLFKSSSAEERGAFDRLVSKSAFLQGAAYRVPSLTKPPASDCYRAVHWYPAAT